MSPIHWLCGFFVAPIGTAVLCIVRKFGLRPHPCLWYGAWLIASWVLVGILAVVIGGTGNVFSLEVGDCFNNTHAGLEEVTDVEIVECSENHHNEVYALSDYPAGAAAPYPSQSSIEAYADKFCFDEFEGYVGASYEDSRLNYSYFYPLPTGWEESDREITCFLYYFDLTNLTESMRGSGR